MANTFDSLWTHILICSILFSYLHFHIVMRDIPISFLVEQIEIVSMEYESKEYLV